ncbi:unnamed protein product [Allacma fusca]|uniref:Lipase domain-containing protein n=1 Tax=Allacma fusca TaxID=39272 RepID=A0A8J2P2S9_9HEXA|nr:unnamed protein product [Allacma fusca]
MVQIVTRFSLFGFMALSLSMIQSSSSKEVSNTSQTISFYLEIRKETHNKLKKVDLNHLDEHEKHIKADSTWYFSFHGWGGSVKDSPILPNMVKALQKSRDCNIVHVDWSYLAKPWYGIAIENIKIVAEYVGDAINKVSKGGKIGEMRIHLVGFSLGAQVVGFLGKYMQAKYNMKPSRITALDPAGPGFNHVEPYERLDSQDAHYVQVIHTSGKSLGIWEPIGHVDLYLNGGKAPQPGCKGNKANVFSGATCSHQMSKKLFAQSMQNIDTGIKCTSWKEFEAGECYGSQTRQTCLLGLEDPKCPEGIYNVTMLLATEVNNNNI